MLQVYGVSLSPFVRKVLVTLEHKGLEYEQIHTMPGDMSPEFSAISPLNKIPVLKDGDLAIPDSSVICRYLEAKHPSPALYPDNPADEAKAGFFEELGDSKLMEACGTIFFQRIVRPNFIGQPTDTAAVERCINELLPPLATYLESVVPQSGYLVGASFGIADLSICSAILQAKIGNHELDANRYPNLCAYFDRILAEPVMVNRWANEGPPPQ